MKKKKVLLVDDQASFIHMLTLKLNQMGYEVLSAQNGQDGLNLAVKESPDLVVMDVMMPIMNGFDAVEAMRSREETAETPVIFLTARGKEEDLDRARDLKAAELFTKPFSPKQVIERITELLEG